MANDAGIFNELTPAEVAGHSLRRGAINAYRDVMRTMGMPLEQQRAWLMMLGRWRSEESVETYLFQRSSHTLAVTTRI